LTKIKIKKIKDKSKKIKVNIYAPLLGGRLGVKNLPAR
jgi:hypothetical protein